MTILGITLGRRSQLALRVLGYVTLGLVAFLFALQMTFPYSRIKDRLAEALSTKYDVMIGGVERGFMPGKMILHNVSLKSRPTQPHQTPSLFYIKQLSLDLGVLALLGKKAVVDIEAQIGDGTLEGTVALSKEQVTIELGSGSLPGANLPFKELVGLPVIGKISLELDLELRLVKNKVDWTKAAGHLQLECPSGCQVGDGKTKLRPAVTRPNQAEMVKDGVEFNKLFLDKFEARVEVKKGVAKVVKWNVPSKDGEVYLDFEAKLEPLLNDSQVTGCLRYNGSAELEKRDYRTFSQLRILGAPLGPDKLFHIRLTGPFRQMKRLPQVCGEAAKNTAAAAGGGGGRTGGPNERRSPDEIKPAEVPPPPTVPTPVVPTPVAPAPPPPPGDAPPAAGAPPPGQPPPGQPPPMPDPNNPNGGVTGGSAVPPPPPSAGAVPSPQLEGAAGSAAGAPYSGRID
jgi:type II secretion system protein N